MKKEKMGGMHKGVMEAAKKALQKLDKQEITSLVITMNFAEGEEPGESDDKEEPCDECGKMGDKCKCED